MLERARPDPRKEVAAKRGAGAAYLVVGMIIVFNGLFVYNYRPYLGLTVIGFGMALFVLGVALTAWTKAT